ncbi:MAG: tRNA amidotransferase [Hatfieldvirus porci]|uniref:tRNA amidotransferase n=1 Tax=phage Lak_Megaphage_RVC_JS4_GC31 TaxID=3109228 RepID=A0ABZ0Z4W8_9CAUD|nr:MAG: tRNA amidotransferase [phage Lak_Megaphage_RVC_AP3_GC31]WQJ53200.1 MAG: tRNA amidotransferase [phage Lak_Megaphage_RVC_JS4_GC31]
MENVILTKYSELIKEAMKAREVVKRETYKLIKTKLQNYMTQPGTPEVTEAVEIQTLNKMIKELVDERDNNAKLNKTERVDELNAQIAVVEALLPKQATEEEINNAIDTYISENGAITQKDMGSVMKYLGETFKNIDRKLASALIRSKF